MGNNFQLANRAKKVRALVLYFDVKFAKANVDPIRSPHRIAAALRTFTDEQWARHAMIAGQNLPSKDTREAIYQAYEDRSAALSAGNVRRLARTN